MEREAAYWVIGKIAAAQAAVHSAADSARCHGQHEAARELDNSIAACDRASSLIREAMDAPVKPEADGADE